jgi:lipid-binding SYLF domain-containing protein
MYDMTRYNGGPMSILSRLLVVVLVVLFGASVARAEFKVDAKELKATIASVQKKNPSLKKSFAKAYGYAVFPTVNRGAIGLGGAYGEGGVFQKGKLVAKTSLTAVSIGLGLGGESYAQIIFFQNKAAFDRFARGNMELGARANAALLNEGVSAEAGYEDGIAIVTVTKGGLMADASVGGQKFTYEKL